MKIPFVGIVKNIVLFLVGVIGSLIVLMFFYYFFLFFAYDLNPDFLKIHQCERYNGTWNGGTRECSLR